jgi:Kef-type K+ transport system membrane component KefB/predicted amino acid-binding ACT domain protein
VEVNEILLDILVVLLVAKIAAEVSERLSIPSVVGEIAAGILVGPSMLGLVEPNVVIHTLAEFGVILLLLDVGLEMDLRELGAVGRASLAVAVLGVVAPFITGALAGVGLGMSGEEAIFVGAALTATSVGITARVFGDLRALATVEARTVLGAAVADDILGLVILTVVTRIVTEGSVSVIGIVGVVVIAIGFVVLATILGVRFVPPLFAWLRRNTRSSGTLMVLAIVFTLAMAELAHAAELAPIIGAFVAGLALARSNAAERIRGELAPIGNLLIPIFFVQIGLDVEVSEFGRPAVLGLAAALFVIAVLGKLISSLGLVGAPGDRLLVGIGMIPRGEVGLIFATLGLREGVFGGDVYAALLLVVLLTTIGTPPVLRWRLLQLRERRRAQRPTAAAGASAGALVAIDEQDRVTIVGEPPMSDALAVAIAAARECQTHAPSEELLEWLDAFPSGPRRIDDKARAEWWKFLESAGARSWHILITSGVLERCLPELDDAIATRPRSAIELDPLATLHFSRLAAVRELLTRIEDGDGRTTLLLAALVLDASHDAPVDPADIARRTAVRLDLGVDVQQSTAGLVNDAGLLTAASRRLDAFDEERVLQLAVHLGTSEQARALHLLTRATFDGDVWESERLDQLYDLVQEVLTHPELTGRDAAYEVDRRRTAAAALTRDPGVRERIESAPREYVLVTTPENLVRHATRCEPAPGRDEVRVAIDDTRGGQRVEIAARDRVGLIAVITRVILEAGCTIHEAVVVTWGDGTAFSSYRIAPPTAFDSDELAATLRKRLREPLTAPPVGGVAMMFDDEGSPWHTRVTIAGTDRPGLLAAVTAAFAVSGVNVHAARATTNEAAVIDTFELTTRDGAKLDDSTKAKVRAALLAGVDGQSSSWRRRFGRARVG